MSDVISDLGYLALGSRLKRLAERLQADATQFFERRGFVIRPSHFPLLTALDRHSPMTVTEATAAVGGSQPAVTRTLAGLVGMGLAKTTVSPSDRRQKVITLTPKGVETVARMKREVWPHIARAAEELAAGPDTNLLVHIARVEASLNEASLIARAASGHTIVEFSDDLADTFYTINEQWIREMFTLESTDQDMLSNPRQRIVDPGGLILFVSMPTLGIVGTCALIPMGNGRFELAKMGVLDSARGLKAGEFLLAAVLDRARQMEMNTLFLLTNSACAAAIHLYEKLGFEHDPEVLAAEGKRYARCDVAMSFPIDRLGG